MPFSNNQMKRSTYTGPKRKLLIAFDVGTTYSGISYSILEPGQVPQIYSVNRFPSQLDSKLPSVMYYDRNGHVCAIGGEGDGGNTINEQAKKQGWTKVEWFKLHYRPHPKSPFLIKIPPLPSTKSITNILSDFYQYLNQCTQQYIQDSHPHIGKQAFWENDDASQVEIRYILSHPNRWDGPPQGVMRQAVEKAGLIRPGGKDKVMFISEGEASLNMCIEYDLLNDSIRKGEGVIMVDAGGGTIDFSAYALKNKSGKKVFEEIVEPQSHFKGSEFVTEFLEIHLKKLLKDSKFKNDISNIKGIFNKTTKHTFRNPIDPCYIHFGNLKDKDPQVGIVKGKLRLEGKIVAEFFKPAIECITETVCEMRRNSRKSIYSVFLVGGFANSEYLFNQVKNSLSQYGLRVRRPDTQTNKAVANGAITHALDNPVRSRVMYRAYGVSCNMIYEPKYSDHIQRQSQCITLLSGEKAIPNGFHLLVSKRETLEDTQELSCQYVRTAMDVDELREIRKDVFFYQGDLLPEEYKWMDNDPDGFQKYCTIKANLPNVPMTSLSAIRGKSRHYKIEVKIILLLGGTEPMAQIVWKDSRGQERRQDADIVYDNDIVSSKTFSWDNQLKSSYPFPSPISPSTSQQSEFPPLSLSPLSPFPPLSLSPTSSTTQHSNTFIPLSPTISTFDNNHIESDQYSDTDSHGWEYVTKEYDSEYNDDVWAYRQRLGSSTMTNVSNAPKAVIPVWKGGRKKLGKRVV